MNAASRWWPWKVALFLLGATALSYLDRQALNVVAPIVQRELGLDNAELGFLMSVFLYSYGAMHLFVGFFLTGSTYASSTPHSWLCGPWRRCSPG